MLFNNQISVRKPLRGSCPFFKRVRRKDNHDCAKKSLWYGRDGEIPCPSGWSLWSINQNPALIGVLRVLKLRILIDFWTAMLLTNRVNNIDFRVYMKEVIISQEMIKEWVWNHKTTATYHLNYMLPNGFHFSFLLG